MGGASSAAPRGAGARRPAGGALRRHGRTPPRGSRRLLLGGRPGYRPRLSVLPPGPGPVFRRKAHRGAPAVPECDLLRPGQRRVPLRPGSLPSQGRGVRAGPDPVRAGAGCRARPRPGSLQPWARRVGPGRHDPGPAPPDARLGAGPAHARRRLRAGPAGRAGGRRSGRGRRLPRGARPLPRQRVGTRGTGTGVRARRAAGQRARRVRRGARARAGAPGGAHRAGAPARRGRSAGRRCARLERGGPARHDARRPAGRRGCRMVPCRASPTRR